MELYHPKYGALIKGKKKYRRLGNKIVQLWVDSKGVARELDGTETETPPERNPMENVAQIVGKQGARGFQGIQGIKGEKGDKGDKGDSIKGDKGDKGDPGLDGKDGKQGLRGMMGMIGLTGKEGKKGLDGKDGSPDKPEQIKEKLETLTGLERLDASAIKNLPRADMFKGGGQSFIAQTKVSADDAVPDYLKNKLEAGTNITITESTDKNRKLTISSSDSQDLSGKANIALDNLASVAMNAPLQWNNSAAQTLDIAPTANTVVGRALAISAGSTVTGGTADMAGGNLTLNSGLGKGTGASSIIFQTGRTLTTGSTLQTLTTAMTILGSGNVGIGTTNPGYALDVVGAGKFSDNLTAGGVLDVTSRTYLRYITEIGSNLSVGILADPISKLGVYGNVSIGSGYFASGAPNNGLIVEGNVGIGTTAPTNLLSLGGNAARIFWMERHTTSNTAGNTLTVQAGGATVAATDKAGGDLILMAGKSTGTGESGVQIQGCPAGSTGTGDGTCATKIQVLGNKLGFHGVTPIARAVLATGVGHTVDDVITALQNLGLVSQA